MDLDSYNKYCDDTCRQLGIPRATCFDPEFSPFQNQFLTDFAFYLRTLEDQSKIYGFRPAYLIVTNDLIRNAQAKYYAQGLYVIRISVGLIKWLTLNIRNSSTILVNQNFKSLNALTKKLDVSLNELLFQWAFHFTFYHELAHLIQYTVLVPRGGLPYLPPGTYSLERHVHEVDADAFASICLGTHLVQYYKRLFGANIEANIFHDLALIGGIASAIFMISLSGKTKLYFKEGTHPHMYCRILYSMNTLTKFLGEHTGTSGTSILPDPKALTVAAMLNAEPLEKSLLGTTHLEDNRRRIASLHRVMAAFLYELNKEALKRDSMAVAIRNKFLGP